MIEQTLIPYWRIDGTLTALGPLRIGNGTVLTGRIPRKVKKGDGQNEDSAVETLGVFIDSTGQAYIPGSSLKGFLRSFMDSRIANHSLIEVAFGYQKEASSAEGRGEGLGGAVTVWDTRIAEPEALPESVADPYWDRTRATCVGSHVVLDRRTRTASDELLFYEEYVPAGIGFDVTLLVEGGELEGWTVDDIAGALLAGLDELRDSPARMGASNADGWGHLEWKPKAVRRMCDKAIANWLSEPGSPLVDHLAPADAAPLLTLGKAILDRKSTATVDFKIDLHFASPFLVNDPSRVKQESGSSDQPNHTPLKAPGGGPLLPASSMRGALRSQAERIARTLGMTVCKPAGKRSERPPAVKTRQDFDKLDAVGRLFGAPGWRSAVRVSDFTLAPESPDPGDPRRQEFVAIDRFTGGGADKLKFNADAFTPAGCEGFTLRGALSLDIGRLALLTDGASGWWNEPLHLLAYTLRDLCEGDIPVGFGRSKGYGACTAQVKLASGVAGNGCLPQGATDLIEGWFTERRNA